ncbi:beta-trefoil DNA-binding domain-containing protein [Mycena leptocephala]|nr:beta-trefoil DNA-binding domain-containing protein [Mycena leptocephala]
MITVICLHGAVAQKSYGNEKRFLCPPPVVNIEAPGYMTRQELCMTVVPEIGERSFEQRAPLDNNMTSNFKFLHVSGTAKAKSFQLSLKITESAPFPAIESADPPPGRVWATFDSTPVTILSKPSKNMGKTGSISSCILAGGPVSLFTRISSQTVRTKYMTIDHAQLCASNVKWSAFNLNVVPRARDPPSSAPQPVTYGCSIVLADTHTGMSTSPLIIRKVEKGRISPDNGGPVNQMQKIALQRVNPDGSRHYLSATLDTQSVGASGSSSQILSHPLLFQSPRVLDETKDGVRVITDNVDDHFCWTIIGISKFQYTFFFGQNMNIPDLPITPFPTLVTAPFYRQINNTIQLTVANFFYADPATGADRPLDVYLGNLGPLRHRVYQATPAGAISPLIDRTGTTDASRPLLVLPRVSSEMHAIVIVEMPALADVIRALEGPASSDDTPSSSTSRLSPPSDNASGAHPAPSTPQVAQSLPLLFIRTIDGVGYHSGRTIAYEKAFQTVAFALG